MVYGSSGRSGILPAIALALIVAWLPPGVARADAPIDLDAVDDVADIPLENLLDKPVVGASRYEQPVSEAPSSVSIVADDEIRIFGYRTLAEVLQAERGFYTTNDRNYTYVGVRGFGIPGDYNSRVLLLVDGHRINDGIYGQAPMGTELALDLDDIARIELVRGPGSSVYGSNAFLGVINVVSQRGADLRGVRATAETSFLDDGNTAPSGAGAPAFTGGRFSLAWGDVFGDLDVAASATYYRSVGVPTLYYPEFDGSATATCTDAEHQLSPCDGLAHHLDGDRYWRGRVQASYHGFTLRAVAGARTKDIPTASFGTIFGDSGESTTDMRAYVDLAYAGTSGPLEVSARTYYDLFRYDGSYPYDGRPTPADPLPLDRQINVDYGRHQGVGAEAQVVATVPGAGDAFTGARLSAGGEVRHTFQGRQVSSVGSTTYLDDNGTESYIGIYAQGEATLAKLLQLSAGLRLDHYIASFGSTLNPRLAAIYSPFDRTRFKLLFGTAFRAPSIYERYYHTPQEGAVVTMNPDLGPEHISTLEIVAEQYLGKDVRASMSAYRYEAHQLIAATELAEGVSQYQNVNSVTTRGLELELEGKWGGTRARVSYAWQRAEDPDSGLHLVNSPSSQFKLNFIIPIIKRRLTLGLESQYMAGRNTVDGGDAPPYFLTNVTLLAENVAPGLTLSLSARNLFDEVYADPGSLDHAQRTVRQDPRTFWLKAVYQH